MGQYSDHELVKKYHANQAEVMKQIGKTLSSGLMFRLFLLQKLPMGLIAGLKIKSVSMENCSVTVPYRWVNQNPFQSTYFAVLAMAAEMSTGMIALMGTYKSKPSVSMLVTKLESEYFKKATGLTTFTCKEGSLIVEAIEKAIATGESVTVLTTTTGTSESGEIESVFKVTWSFKMRAGS